MTFIIEGQKSTTTPHQKVWTPLQTGDFQVIHLTKAFNIKRELPEQEVFKFGLSLLAKQLNRH
jgi:hypothetical protein